MFKSMIVVPYTTSFVNPTSQEIKKKKEKTVPCFRAFYIKKLVLEEPL